ncbi:MAG: hypothetical protein PHF63_12970 [Herbinix sp.]|nr:hypothetical protein [Herbinix sp.]
MLFWNRVEIYCGYSLKDFSELRNVLAYHNIKYDYKLVNNNKMNRIRHGNLTAFTNHETLYYLYVNHKDYDHAMFITSNRNS